MRQQAAFSKDVLAYAQEPEASFDFSAVEARKSGVDGCGVYAVRDIRAGEIVCPLTGILKPAALVSAPGYDRRALQVERDWYLEESGNPDDFINHSCAPNLFFSEDGRDLVAARDIARGEEVLYDYATAMFDGGWGSPCGCGAAQCRGRLLGFSELTEQQQEKIYKKSLPYIRKIYEQSVPTEE